MATVVSAAEIPPGGEGKIEVKVSTRGRKGNLQKTVTVESNDPVTPRFMLKIEATVEVIAGFEPDRLDLQHVLMGETVEHTAKIVSKDMTKLKISDVVSSKPDSVAAELIELEGQPAVKVTVKAEDKPGRISARVTAKTGLDNPKEIQLYVYGQVSADLVSDRSYVFFPQKMELSTTNILPQALAMVSAPLLDRNRSVKVTIKSLSSKPFRITSIEDPEGAVIGSARQEGDEWLVTLLLASKPKSPRGIVKLGTDRSDQPSIDLRYGARASGKPALRPPAKGVNAAHPIRLAPKLGRDARKIQLAPGLRKTPPGSRPDSKATANPPVKLKVKPK